MLFTQYLIRKPVRRLQLKGSSSITASLLVSQYAVSSGWELCLGYWRGGGGQGAVGSISLETTVGEVWRSNV